MHKRCTTHAHTRTHTQPWLAPGLRPAAAPRALVTPCAVLTTPVPGGVCVLQSPFALAAPEPQAATRRQPPATFPQPSLIHFLSLLSTGPEGAGPDSEYSLSATLAAQRGGRGGPPVEPSESSRLGAAYALGRLARGRTGASPPPTHTHTHCCLSPPHCDLSSRCLPSLTASHTDMTDRHPSLHGRTALSETMEVPGMDRTSVETSHPLPLPHRRSRPCRRDGRRRTRRTCRRPRLQRHAARGACPRPPHSSPCTAAFCCRHAARGRGGEKGRHARSRRRRRRRGSAHRRRPGRFP